MRRVFWLLFMGALAAAVGWGGHRIARELWATRHGQAAATAYGDQDFERELQELELCLQVWPDDVGTQFRAARAARRGGDFDKAEKYLARCENSRWTRLPPEVDLDFERACLRAQQGDIEEVKPHLESVIKEKGTASLLALEALVLGFLQVGDTESLSRHFKALLRESPHHLRMRMIKVKLGLSNYDFKGAVQDCRAAMEAHPTAYEPRLLLAKALASEGHIREAIAELQALVEAYPQRIEGRAALGLCRAELHQFDQAAKIFDELLAQHPRVLDTLVERGRVALHQGKAAEAETFFKRALAVNDLDFAARDGLVKSLEKQDKHEEADAGKQTLDDLEVRRGLVFREMIVLQQGDMKSVEAGLAIGAKFLEVGREEEALGWLFNALQLDPRRPETRLALADFYERAGQPHRAAYQKKLAQRTR